MKAKMFTASVSAKFKCSCFLICVSTALTFTSAAQAEMSNFKCEAPRENAALLQIRAGDLITDAKIQFGEPTYEPILRAKPQQFASAAPVPEALAAIGMDNLNQYSVASASSGNFWSYRQADVYISKKLLSLEEEKGNVFVISKQNTLVSAPQKWSVVIYDCSRL